MASSFGLNHSVRRSQMYKTGMDVRKKLQAPAFSRMMAPAASPDTILDVDPEIAAI
jgi:hypothetical protein